MATASFPAQYRSQVGPPQPQPNLSMVRVVSLSSEVFVVFSFFVIVKSIYTEALHEQSVVGEHPLHEEAVC